MVSLFLRRTWNLIKSYMPTNKELYESRLNICVACKHYNKTVFSKRCGKLSDAFNKETEPCGCDLRVKLRMEAMSCPISKW